MDPSPPLADSGDPGFLSLPDQGFEVSEEDLALFKAELDQGERLLWAGRSGPPKENENAGWITALVWAFGCVAVSAVCLAVVFPNRRFQSIEPTAAIIGLISGVIGFFILVGMVAASLSGAAAWRWQSGTRTLYALTDRRAIIRMPAASGPKGAIEVHSIARGQVDHIHRVESWDGSGNVVLHPVKTIAFLPTTFEAIPDVRRVEDLARRVLIERPPA